MAIKSKGKGKSVEARVITLETLEREGCLYLFFVYDKSDADSVDLNVIKKIVLLINRFSHHSYEWWLNNMNSN